MNAGSFQALTTSRAVSDLGFSLSVPDGWQQGRGAFGGFVLAAMSRAAQSLVPADRPLRTLTAEICGPVLAGEAAITVEPLRVGSGTSTLAVRLTQGGEVQAHAVVVFGRSRTADTRAGIERPSMPPWEGLTANQGAGAAFARHLEYRNAGPAPMSGGEARAAGWVRFLDPGEARDGPFIVALADAWWPSLFGMMTSWRPMATLTFSADVVGDCVGLDPAAPFFHDARLLALREGYAPELRTLWGADGRLLCINLQTFVIIK